MSLPLLCQEYAVFGIRAQFGIFSELKQRVERTERENSWPAPPLQTRWNTHGSSSSGSLRGEDAHDG